MDEEEISFDIDLLLLLYESQNSSLCQMLATSTDNLCLCRFKQFGFWEKYETDNTSEFQSGAEYSSKFEDLCLSYFLKNSNVVWNKLHYTSEYWSPSVLPQVNNTPWFWS